MTRDFCRVSAAVRNFSLARRGEGERLREEERLEGELEERLERPLELESVEELL